MTTNKTTTSAPKMRNKTITIQDNKKQVKKMNKMSTYTLDTDYETNTNTVIKYYEKFSQTQIDSILEEAYTNIQAANEENIEFFQKGDIDTNFLFYVSFLIAVRTTSLSKDVPTSVSEQMEIMMDMYNSGLLNRIHSEVLDPAETAKVTDKLQELTILVNKLVNLEETTRDEILATIQNKEILNYGQNNTHKNVVHPLVNPPVDDVDA